MNRRDATGALLAAGALLAWPVRLLAQTGKVFRVGIVGNDEVSGRPYHDALVAGLRELGYVNGRNLVLDRRFRMGDNSRIPALVDGLIAQKPDVLIGLEAIAVVMREKTKTIPIVVILAQDPVKAGLVESLGRPGTNVTGTASPYAQLVAKHIELLTDIVPGISRVAFFGDPPPLTRAQADLEQAARAAASAKRLSLIVAGAGDPAGVAKAFAALEKERPQGLIVPPTLRMVNLRDEIIAQAQRLRLPAVSAVTGALWAEAGGLIFYGPNVVEGWRAAAGYVDKILKGAKPADLPVQLPTRYEFVINLRTARALGIKISQSVLVRADRVIE